MSNTIATVGEIVAELTKRGYKMDPSTNTGVFFDVSSDGSYRSYAIEIVDGMWSINQKPGGFDDDGEELDGDTDLGSFSSASEIADAIDEAEEEFA